jgi:putative Holliday junction resolvase
MDGSLGDWGLKVKMFANKLEKSSGIEVVLWDERLTTIAAERVLLEADMSRRKRKKVINTQAAVIILQNYLDYCSQRRKSGHD